MIEANGRAGVPLYLFYPRPGRDGRRRQAIVLPCQRRAQFEIIVDNENFLCIRHQLRSPQLSETASDRSADQEQRRTLRRHGAPARIMFDEVAVNGFVGLTAGAMSPFIRGTVTAENLQR
jgi:hypothetical protein